jgi:uncharacterized protein with von Willebrand factor type A (vWA) domain
MDIIRDVLDSIAGRDVAATMIGFARTLRVAGVDASTDRVQMMLTALDHLDVTNAKDAYWAGRFCLCSNPDDVARYDAAFLAYFGGEVPKFGGGIPGQVITKVVSMGASKDGSEGDEEGEEEEAPVASVASEAEILRGKDIALLTDEERDDVRRLLARLDPMGPSRRSLRYAPARHGGVDARRTVRAMLRRGGEVQEVLRREHEPRPRRIVLLIDVSGSMEPYADVLLRFAHVVTRRRPDVEVFTIGTRLTRVTRQMRQRDPDAALRAVAHAVPDWSGGTRLGELMKAFLDRWGQRGTARGAVVVIASDGWERGDATLLGEQMARLHRLAYRVVWVNPHRGKEGYQPITAGMSAALPFVDALVAGHTLEAFEELTRTLSKDGLAKLRGRVLAPAPPAPPAPPVSAPAASVNRMNDALEQLKQPGVRRRRPLPGAKDVGWGLPSDIQQLFEEP